jgi:hypothetical protein
MAKTRTSFLGRIWGNYNLSIVLLALFLLTWIGHFIAQMVEFSNEAHAQGESFVFWDFVPAFWQATHENWQSEFHQLLTFVTLTSFLIHRGSPESKDGDEEMMAKLESIEKELKGLREGRPAAAR